MVSGELFHVVLTKSILLFYRINLFFGCGNIDNSTHYFTICNRLIWLSITVHRANKSSNRWTDGRTDARTHVRTDGLTDERTDGRTDERTNGRTDERTNGPTDGRSDGRTGGRLAEDRQIDCIIIIIIFFILLFLLLRNEFYFLLNTIKIEQKSIAHEK